MLVAHTLAEERAFESICIVLACVDVITFFVDDKFCFCYH